MDTLEMMNEAKKTCKIYISNSMRYSVVNGFHDSNDEPWDANAFEYINDIMEIDDWKVLDITVTKKMTLKDIEEKLGYKIELVSS